jgi:hypothetical protein
VTETTDAPGITGGDPRAAALWRLLGAVPADVREVDGVTYVRYGRVAAALAAHDEGAPARQLLREHADAVERVFRAGPVLPARYGILVEDPDDVVEAMLEPNEETLAASLDEVAGRVEVHVRIEQVEDESVAEAVRRDPALRRLAAVAQDGSDEADREARIELGRRVATAVAVIGEDDVSTAVDLLAPLAVSVRGDAPGQSKVLLDVSYLVDEESFDEFDAAVGDVVEALGARAQVTAVGPIPPYSFADLQAG